LTGYSPEKSDRDSENPEDISELLDSDSGQKQFFDFAGPLFSALISPKSSVVSVDKGILGTSLKFLFGLE